MIPENKEAVILQPGKLGDLIICSPIAKFYHDKGYTVEWFVYPEFKDFFERIDYVKPIYSEFLLDNEQKYLNATKKRTSPFFTQAHEHFLVLAREYCDFLWPKKKLLDICWGFPGSSPNNWQAVNIYQAMEKTWIQLRYDLALVPLEERWNFEWNRDFEKENELLKIVKQRALHRYGSEEFSIIHNYDDFRKSEISKIKDIKNCIDFEPIEGYQIYDWLTTLEQANTITCIDSSLCNFVEVCKSLVDVKKYYLGTEEKHYRSFMDNILLNNWDMVKSE